LTRPALIVVALLCVGVACGCGSSEATAAWTPCPRPASDADIRHFRVTGGETCSHAKRVLDWTAFGHEGMCGDSGCRYLGYVCRQRPGGLAPTDGGGSAYTYEDDSCVRGSHRGAWRIDYH
jgi:hypothetical protein